MNLYIVNSQPYLKLSRYYIKVQKTENGFVPADDAQRISFKDMEDKSYKIIDSNQYQIERNKKKSDLEKLEEEEE